MPLLLLLLMMLEPCAAAAASGCSLRAAVLGDGGRSLGAFEDDASWLHNARLELLLPV
jgi:hypothetical protein